MLNVFPLTSWLNLCWTIFPFTLKQIHDAERERERAHLGGLGIKSFLKLMLEHLTIWI